MIKQRTLLLSAKHPGQGGGGRTGDGAVGRRGGSVNSNAKSTNNSNLKPTINFGLNFGTSGDMFKNKAINKQDAEWNMRHSSATYNLDDARTQNGPSGGFGIGVRWYGQF